MKPAANDDVPQVKLETVEGATVTQYDQLAGCYIHDKGKVPFYPGQANPPAKATSKRTKGKGGGKGAAERIVSPVEPKVPVERLNSPVGDSNSKSPVAEKLLSSPVKSDPVVVEHSERHDGIADAEPSDLDIGSQQRLLNTEFQFHSDLFGDGSASASRTDGMDFTNGHEGGIDFSLPTEFTMIPPTEITEEFSVPVNQTDYTRIEVSNHRRKSGEGGEGEPAKLGNGNNDVVAEGREVVGSSVEQCLNSPDKGEGSNDALSIVKQELCKDARLKAGVTMDNVGDLSITDVYLMVIILSYTIGPLHERSLVQIILHDTRVQCQ